MYKFSDLYGFVKDWLIDIEKERDGSKNKNEKGHCKIIVAT